MTHPNQSADWSGTPVTGRLRENLAALELKNTLGISDNYLERAVKDDLNLADALDRLFAEEAEAKRERA